MRPVVPVPNAEELYRAEKAKRAGEVRELIAEVRGEYRRAIAPHARWTKKSDAAKGKPKAKRVVVRRVVPS